MISQEVIDNITKDIPEQIKLVMEVPAVKDIVNKEPEDFYKEQPALRSVVDFKSRNIAQLPLQCFKMSDDYDRVRDRTGKLAKLLKHPNPSMTQYDLIYRLVHDYHLYGWALWYVIPSVNNPSGWEITPIPVAWISRCPTKDGFEPEYYQVTNPATHKTTKLPASDCIRFSMYNPTNPAGHLSPVDSLRQVLAEQISAMIFRNQQWRNGGRFGLFFRRDKDAAPWEPASKKKWWNSLMEKWRGNGGINAGAPMLLPDGMSVDQKQFSSKEAEWVESTKLAREDVAAVFHVSPALVWGNDKQTYASCKENARALYSDTLGPDLRMICDRINAFLIPMIGAPSNEYVEFNIDAKLAGSFEEQTSALTAAVGGPWMTREEARALRNLPKLDNQKLDEVLMPLNLTTGSEDSEESPGEGTETESNSHVSEREPVQATEGAKDAPEPQEKAQGGLEANTCDDVILLKSNISQESIDAITELFVKYFKRQEKSFLNDIAKGRADGYTDEELARLFLKYKMDRWDRELADDLAEALGVQASEVAELTINQLGLAGSFDNGEQLEESIQGFLKKWTKNKASSINEATIQMVARALDPSRNPFSKDEVKSSTVEGVFEVLTEQRAQVHGDGCTKLTESIARVQAVQYSGKANNTYKIWRSGGKNTRSSHAKMNGEQVPFLVTKKYGNGVTNDLMTRFSNGQRFPGDYLPHNPAEVANCHCSLEFKVVKKDVRGDADDYDY